MEKFTYFIAKKHKIIMVVLFFLFMFKCTQSCVRDQKIEKLDKNFKKELNKKDSIINNYKDTAFALRYSVDIQKVKAEENAKRANDLKEQAASIRTNTRVTIKTEESSK